jgi:hypothetical protein
MSFRFSGPRVQAVDRPAEIQALPEPPGAGRARVDAKALGVVTRPEFRDRIHDHLGCQRRLGQRAAVRPPELERPVGPARHLKTLLVHRAVMPAAEQREIREGRGPAMGPVMEVMPLSDANAAARQPAAPVSML